MPLAERRTHSLRDAVIRLYEKRLPMGRLGEVEGIWGLDHMRRRLARLRAGQNVQLHRFGELDSLPTAHRPQERTWSLYELRGDTLVPVPTWEPGCPPPRQWTVPVTAPDVATLWPHNALKPRQST
jgi:hypothetical protein